VNWQGQIEEESYFETRLIIGHFCKILDISSMWLAIKETRIRAGCCDFTSATCLAQKKTVLTVA
jgi:hypothetical protein